MSDLFVNLRIKATEGVTAVARRVRSEMDKVGSSWKKASEHMKTAGDLRNAAEGVSRFAAVTRGAVLKASEAFEGFEDKMALLRAETGGLTNNEMAALSDQAHELARTTRFTSEQAVAGYTALANAGMSAAQQMEALPAVMRLAQAHAADLGSATRFTSKTLRGFGLEASEMSRVVDVMSQAAGEGGMPIQEMGEILARVAPKAHGMNVSLEETASLVAALGKAGVEGAEAGLAMTEIVKRLSVPKGTTKEGLEILDISRTDKATGKLKGLGQMIQEIAGKTSKMSEGRQATFMAGIFGDEGGAFAAQLVRGIQSGTVSLEDLKTKMVESTGRTAELSEILNETGAAASERLGKVGSEAMETLGKSMSDALTPAKELLGDMLERIIDWTKEHPRLTEVIMLTLAAASALATLLAGALYLAVTAIAVKGAIMFMGGIGGMMGSLTGFTFVTKTALPWLAGLAVKTWALVAPAVAAAAPFLAVAAAIGAVTLAIMSFQKHWDNLNGSEVWKGIKESFAEDGIASTMLQFVDPRALLSDLGLYKYGSNKAKDTSTSGGGLVENGLSAVLAGVPSAERMGVTPAGAQAPGRAALDVKIGVDSEGRAAIKSVTERGSAGLDIDAGMAMAY